MEHHSNRTLDGVKDGVLLLRGVPDGHGPSARAGQLLSHPVFDGGLDLPLV